MFKKRCKSNKNKTNIQFFHELFTGYFIKYFNPLPFHLIIKRIEPHEGSSRCSTSQGAWHGVTPTLVLFSRESAFGIV